MVVKALHQQQLSKVIGEDKALRACLPTCFFMLARANGYLGHTTFNDFSRDLDWDNSYARDKGWLRPKLTQELRERYHVPIVSWKLAVAPTDAEAMKTAGYVDSRREQQWYQRHGQERTIEQIVRAGTPLIVTMRPGFAANTSAHAIILLNWNKDRVEIIDPDARNEQTHYTSFEISAAMSPIGAASVVLPRL